MCWGQVSWWWKVGVLIILVFVRYIVGVDINDGKFSKAIEMGATECVNSITCEGGDVKVGLGGDFTGIV